MANRVPCPACGLTLANDQVLALHREVNCRGSVAVYVEDDMVTRAEMLRAVERTINLTVRTCEELSGGQHFMRDVDAAAIVEIVTT